MERLKLNIQLFGGSLAITAYETDVSVDNNTSYIYVELKPSTNSTTYNENGTAYVQATLTGQNDTYSISKTYFNIGKGKTVTAYSGKIGPFHHNADGSLNNVSISASAYIVSNTQPTATASVAMSTIPRASSISSISGNIIGSPTTVTISRQSSSFTHKLQVVYGEKRTDWIDFGSNLSKQFTIPMDFCNSTYLSSTTNGQFIFTLVTYSNGTAIGSENQLYTMYVPDSVKPSTPSITKNDTTNNYSTHGAYVKGKSGVRVQSSASGSYGSTITGYTVKLKSGNTVLQTLTGSDVTFSSLNYTGTITIEVTATDTRNRSTANTTTISIADYANPNVSVFKAERLSNDSTVTITYTASITNINSHNSNAKTFSIYKRQKGTSSWGTAIATYTSGYSYSGTKTETCSENYGWEFKIDATDSYTTASKTAEVGTTFELMNWKADGTAMAIGKVSETSNTFETGIPTKFYDTVSLLSLLYSTQETTGVERNSRIRFIGQPVYSYLPDATSNTEVCCKALLKWICNTYPNDVGVMYIFTFNPNAQGFCFVHIYNNSAKDSTTGLPQYSSGVYRGLDLNGTYFGTYNYTWQYRDVSANKTALTDVNNNFSTHQTINGNVYANGGYLYTKLNNFQTQIGSANDGFCHYMTEAPRHYFNKPVYISGDIYGGSSYNRRLAYIDEFGPTSGTATCTKSSGNGVVSSATWYKYGRVVQLDINFYTTGTTAAGSNIWQGTVSGVSLPIALHTGCGFYSSNCFIGALETNGTLTIRSLAAQSPSATGDRVVAITYISAS